MERKKALVASAIIAATLMSGAVAYAAGSSLMSTGSPDSVGQLEPTGVLPTTITVVLDPATGAITASTPPRVTTVPTSESHEAREHEDGEDDD